MVKKRSAAEAQAQAQAALMSTLRAEEYWNPPPVFPPKPNEPSFQRPAATKVETGPFILLPQGWLQLILR